MSKRGPLRTPTAILKLRGSSRAKSRQKSEPIPTGSAPPCPVWLLPEAQDEWARLLPQLDRLGLLTGLDWGTFGQYCQCFAHWVRAEQFMASHGDVMTVRDNKGSVKWTAPVPQFGIAQKSLEKMQRLASEFGLSPASRARLAPSDSASSLPGDAIAAYFAKEG